MKNSAAVPSGALAKRRVRNLTKLMSIIFARYLGELDRLCRLIPVGSIHALLCRSTRGVMSSRADGDVSRVVAFLRVDPRDSATRESVLRAIAMLYVIPVSQRLPPTNPWARLGRARHEWLFRLRFAQSRVAQLDLAPTLGVFASRSVISTPPRFARDYFACATRAVFAETHRLRTSDAEHDQGVCRKPS